MGIQNSTFIPCYDHTLPSSGAGLEEFRLIPTNTAKTQIKKLSISTSETISILPVQIATSRSSITEFIVSRCESISDKTMKNPETRKKFKSLPCSPGKCTAHSLYRRGAIKESKNIVDDIRSKSNTGSPAQTSVNRQYFARQVENNFINNQNKTFSSIGKRRGISFEPLNLEKIMRKRLY